MSDLTMTDEQFRHAQLVIGRNVDLAARQDASGRSSMPILVDDLLLFAGLAMHALTTAAPDHAEARAAMTETTEETPDGNV